MQNMLHSTGNHAPKSVGLRGERPGQRKAVPYVVIHNAPNKAVTNRPDLAALNPQSGKIVEIIKHHGDAGRIPLFHHAAGLMFGIAGIKAAQPLFNR